RFGFWAQFNEGSLGVQAVSLTRRFSSQCRRQAMQSPKRIEPVENEQADYHSTQRKIPRLKSFDARIERREPLPVQIYLANLEEPRARRTHCNGRRQSPRCSTAHQTMLAARRSTAGYPLDGRVSEARSSRLL